MNEIAERVADAISEACDYALPPFLLDKCARAAIAEMRATLVREAQNSRFISDQEALYCAVETFDDALK